VISFQVYINSFLALLNARYYLQGNASTIDSRDFHIRHEVYRPELHIMASQGESLEVSKKTLHPDNEVIHPTRPAQAALVGSCIIFD